MKGKSFLKVKVTISQSIFNNSRELLMSASIVLFVAALLVLSAAIDVNFMMDVDGDQRPSYIHIC